MTQFRPQQTALSKIPVTKAMLLAQAKSPLSRLWIHVQWPLTRNNRPFSLDEISAIASWLVMGNVLWIILGTTTFGLVVMYLVSTVEGFWESISPADQPNQSFLGFLAGSVLSHGLGAQITFEAGGALPKLEDGMLKFSNISISSNTPDQPAFSAKIAGLNVSLSFKKWYEGNGLIYNTEIRGMRAKVTRAPPSRTSPTTPDLSPAHTATFNSMAHSFSRVNDLQDPTASSPPHNESDVAERDTLIDANYEFAHVKITDSSIELYESSQASPLRISIFNCDLPRLRGDRLLVDFFNANIVTGTINNSMFTIHKKQTVSNTGNNVRFKLDGIDMGMLAQANPQSKFNWLVSGKAEIVADIHLPAMDRGEADAELAPSGILAKVFGDIADITKENPTVNPETAPLEDGSLFKDAILAVYETFAKPTETASSDADYVVVTAKVKFTDMKATLPAYLPMASSSAVPFISLQSLRSLIAYVNSMAHEPFVTNTTAIEKVADLRNVDHISQTRIFDSIVSDIYDDMLRMIKLDEKRILEERSSMWSHSVVSQLLLLGLGVLA